MVSGVSTTPITCPNNGSITVNATTSTPPLFFSIVGGPVIQPVQGNPVFNSLLPGNYAIKITDGGGHETTVPAVVGGTYTNPDFTATATQPACTGQSNGAITGNMVPGTGLPPFTWQLMAPSPVTAAPQPGGTFTGLPAGNYTTRVADACGSYKTTVVTVSNPYTPNPFYGGAIANKVGCDAMHFRYSLTVNDFRPPLTYKYKSSAGSVHTYTAATQMLVSSGYCQVDQVVPGIDYGETVTITVYNACGDSTVSSIDINPFTFYPKYSFDSCGRVVHLSFLNDPNDNSDTGVMPDLSYTLTETASGTLVDQGTLGVTPPFDLNSTYISGFSTVPVHTGGTYRIHISDGCGDTFTQDYFIPGQAAPAILGKYIVNAACIDSVLGVASIYAVGFTDGKLTLTSGPAVLGSTKPGFEYSDTYTYPHTVTAGYGGEYWFLQNLAAGTYHFTIADDCGFSLSDSLVVLPSQVSHLTKELSYKKGCLGRNTIYYGMMERGRVTITKLNTNSVILVKDLVWNTAAGNRDSLMNVPAGRYEVLFEYNQIGYGTPVNDRLHDCRTIRDTIDIDDYHIPEMVTGNAILCHDDIHFVLEPDTTKGVAPYRYEIIAGPQIFPEQSPNVFTVSLTGTYTARILDVCGNASTKQITVDTVPFEPLVTHTRCNNTGVFFPASPYYTYTWLMPDLRVHTGDSLVLEPVTPADTGIYHITRVVDIDGCTDTARTTYHVTLLPQLHQTVRICPGDSVTVGTHTYFHPGIYSDTLGTSGSGCDSILVTTLQLYPGGTDTLRVDICPGDSLLIAGRYYRHSGFYTDSLVSVHGCDSIRVWHVTARPYILRTVNASVCTGHTYPFGGLQLQQAGTYIDTLATAACDSIVTLHLTVLPAKSYAYTQTICQGDHFSFGGHSYTLPGTYTHTVPTADCDSTVTLTLLVDPLKHRTVYASICEGEKYAFGNIYYSQPGTYTHSFPTQTCDSIVTLHIHVFPAPSVTITAAAHETAAGASVQLLAHSASHPLQYSWLSDAVLNNPSIWNPVMDIASATWVSVTVTDTNGCTATGQLEVKVPVTSSFYIPNTYTPDGDAHNPVFRVYGTNIAEFEILIFDRWGELIYQSVDMDSGWDGTYMGESVQNGMYVYKVKAIGLDHTLYNQIGHVTVLR